MRIIVIGGTGTIGKAVVTALGGTHEVIVVARTSSDHRVDITSVQSIGELFNGLGPIDAVVVTAGQAAYKPFAELEVEDFAFSLGSKLMGQVNIARIALPHIRDGGSITLTSGSFAREPVPNGAAISLVNAGLEGFVGAAALELPRGIRINVVSPPIVGDLRLDATNTKVERMPASDVARAYVESVEGTATGRVIDTRPFAQR